MAPLPPEYTLTGVLIEIIFCHKKENWLKLRVRPRAERVSRQPAEIFANELSGPARLQRK